MIPALKRQYTIATRRAMRLRMEIGVARTAPLNAFNLADEIELPVYVQPAPSMEGLYVREPGPRIVISSLRPVPRQAFTCAHEIGHHVLGHGTTLDKQIGNLCRWGELSPEERAASSVAAELLMPKAAVVNALRVRELDARRLQPIETYCLSNQFGVGYTTMINQLRWSLNMIDKELAEDLARTSPKEIRRAVLGNDDAQYLVVADKHWRGMPVDIEVGHAVVLPEGSVIEGSAIHLVDSCPHGMVAKGMRAGVARALCPIDGWATFIRVSKPEYRGHAEYRHQEDPDDD